MDINPKVVDLSHYDDVQDQFAGAWEFGIRGVINKRSEGTGLRDQSFDWRRPWAKDKGIHYGGYHFLRPGRIREQAQWFVECLGDHSDLLLACDHEDRKVDLDQAQEWCEAVHGETGRWPILYSGFLLKAQILRAGPEARAFWKQRRLWLAHYSSRPRWPTNVWDKLWLWQYTGDGSGPAPHHVPGIRSSGGTDMNSYDGSDDQLAAEWLDGLTPVVA